MKYSLDTPTSFISLTSGVIEVSGHFEDDRGRPARHVRVRLGDRIVKCRRRAVPHGFTAVFITRLGPKYLIIEAETEDGSFHEIGRRLVCVYSRSYQTCCYRAWHEENELRNPPAPAPAEGPRISVIMPVYNTPAIWLSRAIKSVQAQTYTNWELCIADDASTAAHIDSLLTGYIALDPRIKLARRATNGHISAASNSALELASGEFIAFLNHDDELAPHALAEIARSLAVHPAAQILYTDEDMIDRHGHHSLPYFKPDWNPDLLLSQNYLGRLSVYRTQLLHELGGLREGCEGAQDWDLALRATSRVAPGNILHVPQVLYHWRAIPGSTALKQNHKSYAITAARRVLCDHLARARIEADVLPVRGGSWRTRRKLPASPPRVSLIIPTRNRVALLRTCVESILKSTHYSCFEILIIDNGSDDPATLAYLKNLGGRGVKILRDDGPFNYSALNNRAVAHTTGEVLGFLNNDLKLITPDWLDEMVSHAIRPEVGAVGAMLYFPDNRVQHAGVVLGLAGPRLVNGIAGHAFKFFPRGHTGMRNRLRVVQNYSAVTAACLLVRREVFLQAGGFNEKHLAVAYNDVDFCLRLGVAGYRNVWTPFAEFYHYESASRGADDTPAKKTIHERECAYMRRTWGPLLDSDPAYNPNLTLVSEDFAPSCRPIAGSDAKSPPDPYEFTRIPERPASRPGPHDPQSLVINWIMPDFVQGSGGHMTIFRMASHLQRLGHRSVFWITGGSAHRDPGAYIDIHFFPLQCPVHALTPDNLDEVTGDVVFATQCWTAYYVRGIRNVWRKCYFVQDYEPYFYPLGTDYHYARRTYHFGFQMIVAGWWLQEMLRRESNAPSHVFNLAYDPKYYQPAQKSRADGPLRIAFYARASTERRMVVLGLQALALLGKTRRDFVVHFFGEEPQWKTLGYAHIDAGVLTEAELGDLYRSSDLGMVFSATNHSLIPVEMMACGLPVMELAGENNALIYPPGSIALAEPDEQSVANLLGRLLDSAAERAALRASGLAYAATLSWEASAKKVTSALLDINPPGAESRLPH